MRRTGKNHPNWKGGRTFSRRDGYVVINIYNEPEFHNLNAKNKYTMLEHRYVMIKYLGRKLGSDEIVHHKNGIKTDNRIENLEILKRDEHTAHHHKKGLRIKIKERICFHCNNVFFPRTSNSNQMYCSIKCGGISRRGIRTKPIKKRKCPYCKKIFEPPFNSKKTIFCTITCANKSRSQILLQRKCPTCGKRFYPGTKRNSSKQRFCSIVCGVRKRCR